MRVRELGATGLSVTEVGLGTGGYSVLGLHDGGLSAAVRTARAAVEAGLRFIDTAPAYGSEQVVGALVRELDRADLTISTKVTLRHPRGAPIVAADVTASLERSLTTMGLDEIDVLLLHGVRPSEYEYCRDVLLPVLEQQRAVGKIRAIGLSESFSRDPEHSVARWALADGTWQVILIGLNLLNPTADDVFGTVASRIGVVVMHAVRSVLASRRRLVAHLAQVVDQVDLAGGANLQGAIEALETGEWDRFFPAVGYWYALQRPYVSSVLMGSSSADHLKENMASMRGLGSDIQPLLELLEGALAGSTLGSGDPMGQRPNRTARFDPCDTRGGA